MSEISPARRGPRVRMRARAADEPHRRASQLELLFDLTFVVAVASLTAQLAHGIAENHLAESVLPFLQVFFAIWWAWMNFTWFASAFDTDDALYRLLTMVQMGGVLLLGAGVPAAFNDGDYLAVTLGFIVMRVGLIAQWLRAAIEDPASRRTALRYAVGFAVLQLGWVLRLVLQQAGLLPGQLQLVAFVMLAILELTVPLWAERTGHSSWHPHHIAERYGLFAIILLGESVLAASNGVATALTTGGVSAYLIAVSAASLALLFSLWWLYFLPPAGEALSANREKSYQWGYWHYAIFAALAALGAGLEVAITLPLTGPQPLAQAFITGYCVAIPTAVFMGLLWAIHSPLTAGSVIRPSVILPAVATVLAIPASVSAIGVVGVVGGIAVVCALVVAVTVLQPGHKREAS
ncbi:low temperature requirement protein A [Arthrobacter sp. ISL-28]|uniref:low temperature requirement protein A n=1 Tax=Arthrobacter sp. ISL-28 TaxID=2819108 RepID=UPI001BEC93DB|nr:low temperature requirement protein A [Arthrobacter sp. ISL-28]MBT2521727.1 low temperature requirement protein A [Arthrobacter sp. ISL-28]